MSEAIVTALITGLCAIAAQMVISRSSARELYARLDKQSELSDAQLRAEIGRLTAVTDARIDELTREVRRHNGFAERIPALEERQRAADKRIDALANERRA